MRVLACGIVSGTLLAGSLCWIAAGAQGLAQAPGAPATAGAASGAAQAPAVKAVTPPAKKKGKEPYTGPTEVIALAPTPMLDEEGKQRLDPDGKPMFNPPVLQQRDKKGHPLFDEKGKPVFQTATDLGYDDHGHRIKPKKEKPPKMTPVSIERGTFTVDGVIGKAALNYQIADLKYIYLYVPGDGIVVVSNQPFAGAIEQKGAFQDNSLKVNADGHTLELASDKRLLGKKPQSAFVLVNREYTLASKFPVVGYGTLRKPPYAWPGARENAAFKGPIQPPPVPVDLRPVLAKPTCKPAQAGKAPAKDAVPCVTPAKPAAVPVAEAKAQGSSN